jgi:hypothetical protein
MRSHANAVVVVVTNLVASVLLLEGSLRIQQWLGPLNDLQMREVTTAGLSDSLHHKPLAVDRRQLVGAPMYGPAHGLRFIERHDAYGIRVSALQPLPYEQPGTLRVLFLGDSFMQGYDDENTIPQHVWQALKEEGWSMERVRFLNAGFSSYAPSIMTVQARQLIPVVKPSLVVVDIDETDVGDETRYDCCIQRDAQGRIVAVRASVVQTAFLQGLIDIRNEPLYLVRLLRKLYHTRVSIPRMQAARPHAGSDVLAQARAPEEEARIRFAEERARFRDRVNELVATLVELLGTPARVLVIHHPHRQHLEADDGQPLWNDFVARTLAEVSRERGVRSYDATPAFRANAKVSPKTFYWQGDMHFNFEGLRCYGRLVAHEVSDVLGRIPEASAAAPAARQ